MNKRLTGPPAPTESITLQDVYYILFRRKWLILLLITLGIVSTVAVCSLWRFPQFSEARIYVRYIQETPTVSDIDGHTTLVSPDQRGLNIINTELQILTSSDLAMQAATNLGPAIILGKADQSNNVNAAAATIHAHLLATVSNNCDVINLSYSSTDPALPQKVLAGLIAAYKSKYVEIHNTPSYTDATLQEQSDLAKDQLRDAMRILEDQKVKLHITSLPDAAKNLADEIAKTEDALFQARSEIASNEAVIKDIQERVSETQTGDGSTNRSRDLTAAAMAPATPEVLSQYQTLTTMLNNLILNEQNLMTQFTTNTPIVKNAQQQRMAAEAALQRFQQQNPNAAFFRTATSESGANPSSVAFVDPALALRDAMTTKHTLMARYGELTNQLVLVQTNASRFDSSENVIMQAQTEMEVASNKYDHFLKATEQARINDAIGNKVSGISVVEQPTPPAYDRKALIKIPGAVFFFFMALAFGVPILIEKVLDQSFKHPMEVKSRINAPFFLTIPRTNGHGKFNALKRAGARPMLSANGSGPSGSGTDVQTIAPRSNGAAVGGLPQELRPFMEALRDRLISYFEMINLTHKPKLVAVTSCAPGAGVTTTAAGLASSLSETGEGNVLLVNMNVPDGEAHHFYKGKMDFGIEDALEHAKRDQAQVHDNLFVAHAMGAGDGLPRVLPKRFSHLVPLMKASDYDYIIFDMPPVSEISITPRLARFMDMVLLVIESEKTPRDVASRVASLLAESKTNVGLVLNKNRSYLPKRLEQTI